MSTTTPTMDEEGERSDGSRCSSTLSVPVSPFLNSPVMRTPRIEALPPRAMMSPPRLVRCVYYTDNVDDAFERAKTYKLDEKAEMAQERSGDIFLDLLDSPSSTFVLASPAEVSCDTNDQSDDSDDDRLDTDEDINDDHWDSTSSFRPIRPEVAGYLFYDRPSPVINLRPRPTSGRVGAPSWSQW
jgi:hypothetical protein